MSDPAIVTWPDGTTHKKECHGGCSQPEFVEKLPAVVYWPPISWPGMPTLEGHRLNAEFLAERALVDGFDGAMEDFEVTKADLLVCLWWAGAYGSRKNRRRWGEWADDAWKHLWSSCVNIPLPPGVPA